MKITRHSQKIDEPYNKTTVISWKLPCRANAIITKFVVECHQISGYSQSLQYNISIIEQREEYSFPSEDFLPDSKYNVSIRAETKDGTLGKIANADFVIEAGCKLTQAVFISEKTDRFLFSTCYHY